jgi:hypothetical protein
MRLINRFFLDVFFRAAILIIFNIPPFKCWVNENLYPILIVKVVTLSVHH